MPLKGETRNQWIDVIKENQEFPKELQEILTYINICALHFKSEDILKNGRLKKGAIPKIVG